MDLPTAWKLCLHFHILLPTLILQPLFRLADVSLQQAFAALDIFLYKKLSVQHLPRAVQSVT